MNDNEALDYVARLVCPPTHMGYDSREALASRLLSLLSRTHKTAHDDELLPLLKLSEALMGATWTKLYLTGLSQR